MWNTIQEWWEEWFDRLNWLGVGLIVVAVGIMLYTHQGEVDANIVKGSAPATTSRLEQKRPPEADSAVRQTIELWEKKQYQQVVDKAAQIIKDNPKQAFAYLFMARAYREMNDPGKSIVNYSQAVKYHPDFVDKKSADFLGHSKYYGKELKPFVDKVIAYSQSPEFSQRPDKDKVLKEIYYLQRRLAGGCE